MAVTASGTVKPPPSSTSKTVPPKPSTSVPKPAPQSKFSVLEYINRGDSSETATKPQSPGENKTSSRKRKHVSWAPEDDLETIKMIENITIQYADDLFWHPPQAFGNARDLDIGEGRTFGKDLVEYDMEEEIEWYEPKGKPARNARITLEYDFSQDKELKSSEESRGIKRAGRKVPDAREAEAQKLRESSVLMVTYLDDGDIPDSPSEPFLDELVASQNVVTPKVIPLPQELRVHFFTL
jgi:protein phosphatase 1 regulatory subunit 10